MGKDEKKVIRNAIQRHRADRSTIMEIMSKIMEQSIEDIEELYRVDLELANKAL